MSCYWVLQLILAKFSLKIETKLQGASSNIHIADIQGSFTVLLDFVIVNEITYLCSHYTTLKGPPTAQIFKLTNDQLRYDFCKSSQSL